MPRVPHLLPHHCLKESLGLQPIQLSALHTLLGASLCTQDGLVGLDGALNQLQDLCPFDKPFLGLLQAGLLVDVQVEQHLLHGGHLYDDVFELANHLGGAIEGLFHLLLEGAELHRLALQDLGKLLTLLVPLGCTGQPFHVFFSHSLACSVGLCAHILFLMALITLTLLLASLALNGWLAFEDAEARGSAPLAAVGLALII